MCEKTDGVGGGGEQAGQLLSGKLNTEEVAHCELLLMLVADCLTQDLAL